MEKWHHHWVAQLSVPVAAPAGKFGLLGAHPHQCCCAGPHPWALFCFDWRTRANILLGLYSYRVITFIILSKRTTKCNWLLLQHMENLVNELGPEFSLCSRVMSAWCMHSTKMPSTQQTLHLMRSWHQPKSFSGAEVASPLERWQGCETACENWLSPHLFPVTSLNQAPLLNSFLFLKIRASSPSEVSYDWPPPWWWQLSRLLPAEMPSYR